MNCRQVTVFLPLIRLKGVVEGDLAAVEAYKTSGGDIARQLTSDEVRLLNRPSAFDDGFTLVHLAIRFQRQDMLAVLLTEVSQKATAALRFIYCALVFKLCSLQPVTILNSWYVRCLLVRDERCIILRDKCLFKKMPCRLSLDVTKKEFLKCITLKK